MHKTLLGSLAGLLIGAGVVFLALRTGDSTHLGGGNAARTAGSPYELELREALAQRRGLEQRLARLEGLVTQPAAVALPDPSPSKAGGETESDDADGRTEPTDEPDRATIIEARRAAFEERFRTSAKASAWGLGREQAVAVLKSRDLVAFSCRSDICRMETKHGGPAESEAFYDQLEFSPVLQNSTMTRLPTDETRTGYVYFFEPNAVQADSRQRAD